MKQVVFFLSFFLVFHGYTYSQADTLQYVTIDTASFVDIRDDIVTSFSSIREGQFDDEDGFMMNSLISGRASGYCKQVHASYSLSNRNYNHRLMLTAASGLLKEGWYIVGSASARFGDEISYQSGPRGTTYTGFSAFLGVEKQFNKEHALHLSAFVSPTERGMQAGAVKETFDLANSNYYNPNWGWYEGKRRNACMRKVIEPAILLTHYFTPESNKYKITTTFATSFGRNNTTGLNWHDAPDPRPDYYKYLPSYFLNNKDTVGYFDYRNGWLTDANVPQIDWYTMYHINQLAKHHVDSLGNLLPPLRAQYMIEKRVTDHFELGGASNLVLDISNNLKLSTGVDILGLKQRNYKTINDLLGGAFWLDVDKFSGGAFPDSVLYVEYNDVNKMDLPLKEGDKFGYDYNFVIYRQKVWAMLDFTFPIIDIHFGGQLGATEMWRIGFMKNGRFQNDSEGKSTVKSFFEGAVKAGVTYKITCRNYLVLNSEFVNTAPNISNAFFAPRIRNTYINNLKSEKNVSVNLSYLMKYPFMKMRASLFFKEFYDISKTISFYSGDHSTMVNDVITGMNQRHLGAELGTEIKLCSMFWVILDGTFSDFRFSNNPAVYTNFENGTDLFEFGKADQKDIVYWKNYFVAGSPQVTGTVGIKFNHKYWLVYLNANYFDRIYSTINPDRRTSSAAGHFDLNDPEQADMFQKITDQHRMKGQFTLDVSVSKSWRIKNYTIGFIINVSNITNNKKMIASALESSFFDYKTFNPAVLQDKYSYALGTTFFAGFNFTFN